MSGVWYWHHMRMITDSFHDPAHALKWLVDMGADEAVSDTPIDRFAATKERAETLKAPTADTRTPKAAHVRPAAAPKAPPTADSALGSISEAEAMAQAAETLDELQAALAAFNGGQYQKTAKSLVFADGTPGADLMIIGEAPGAEEDRLGKPFVGPSGALLDKMLAAIGRTRNDSAYITNILPWRPLGNRTPDLETVNAFLPFVHRHIALAGPRVVMAVGGVSAKALTGKADGITRLRGRWHRLENISPSGHDLALMPTYHPAYLLRNPVSKAQAWLDLLSVKEALSSDA